MRFPAIKALILVAVAVNAKPRGTTIGSNTFIPGPRDLSADREPIETSQLDAKVWDRAVAAPNGTVLLGRNRVNVVKPGSWDGRCPSCPTCTSDCGAFDRLLIDDALRQLCRGTGCDGGATYQVPATAVWTDLTSSQSCSWTITAEGDFQSEDVRDFMIQMMTTALSKTTTNSSRDFISGEPDVLGCGQRGAAPCDCYWYQSAPGCTRGSQTTWSMVNYQQVDIRTGDGSNTAQLKYTVAEACKTESLWLCNPVTITLLGGALSLIPTVGPFAGMTYTVLCQEFSPQ
ncbi:uncharacterized protein MAM_04486 [Metarhizium album ARSEF 1941]|uniref:CUB domain-containing protein n=1 Tax=Metarhizium album (strain ARSEF 1941) TaxID=1081103 RepID=A0A0B2WN27_METAS|nr:uncharacterized protein MAM_04486 [Metarhizium album ARSEF 1941]KHN97471.1 hypothetical protein MAM_04486 [Metarhizium album ARSEF 1941]